MDYSRRDFLKVAAAGLPVVALPWFASNPAYAGAEIEGAYSQAEADRIHNRSMEEALRQAGRRPQEALRPFL